FVGVTYVRTYVDTTHVNWTLYGRLNIGPSGRPEPAPVREVYGDEPEETFFPDMLAIDDRPVLMAVTPLDKADVPMDEAPTIIGYDTLPDPLLIDGYRVVDTKKLSNNIRFHDCLFVGSIVSDTPQVYLNARN